MKPFPPSDYIPAQSTIAGIEVYMPRPAAAEKHEKVVNFKCPQCDGTTAFSTDDGGITCGYCGHHEAPQKEVVGKQAEEFEFKTAIIKRATHGWGIERNELQCQTCAALTVVPTDSLTHTCPFCGSNQVIQHKAPQDVLRPRFLVPFQVEKEKCASIAREWLGSSWMTPSSLKKLASIDEFVPVYIPYWTFDANTTGHWQAEVGHTETRRVRTSDGWKTETVTVWRWESGTARLNHDDLLVSGTSRLSELLLSQVQNYNTQELVNYEASYLVGLQAQAYDVELEPAWEKGRHEMREKTRQACRSQASTSKIRNFSMKLDFSDESWRYILLPLYIAVYNYENKRFQVMVNGQTGKIAGQRPVDWIKVWLAVAACMAPGLILGFIALITLALGVGAFIGMVAFILLAVGLIVSVQMVMKAQKLDDI